MRFAGLLCVCALLASCTKLVDPDNAVVATVDGEKIRISDVLDRIGRTSPEERLEANTPEGRQKILENLIDEAALLQAAEAASLTVTEEEVSARLARQEASARSGGAAGQDVVLNVIPDPADLRRIMLMELVTAPHLSAEKVEARYEELSGSGDYTTVQYEFFSVLASTPTLAMDIERQMRGGAAAQDLTRRYRSHPAFVSAGTAEPLLLTLLDPWLQREIAQHRVGDMLPPWQTTARGEPTIELIRLLNVWERPPLEITYPYIVEELYTEFLESLKAQYAITRFPERLSLIDRR